MLITMLSQLLLMQLLRLALIRTDVTEMIDDEDDSAAERVMTLFPKATPT
ncbi:Uncharacterised protein [Salmonella enterica subsp. enterica serovar Oranienburg]|nr:Uncharacterised protein [Salmonella enterica subsp. enterica serovar Oranienburg]